jgi:hypothetical protein
MRADGDAAAIGQHRAGVGEQAGVPRPGVVNDGEARVRQECDGRCSQVRHRLGRPRAGALSIATSSKRHPTNCPRSTSTASEPCRMRGHSGRTRRASAPTPEKRHSRRGRQAFQAVPAPLLEPGRREHAAHGPLISMKILEEVTLTGLSFVVAARRPRRHDHRRTRWSCHAVTSCPGWSCHAVTSCPGWACHAVTSCPVTA